MEELAAAAGIGTRTYRRALRAPKGVRASVVRKLELGLKSAQAARTLDAARERALVGSVYGGFLVALCRDLGLDPDAVRRQDPRAGATADAEWARHAHARQAALYLTNTAVDVKQRRLAEIAGLTPAAVCLGLKSVEDRRDDPEFDALLDRVAAQVTGTPAW